MMIDNQNQAVLKYLKSLPKSEAAEVKDQLIKNLEALQQRSQAARPPGSRQAAGTTGRPTRPRPEGKPIPGAKDKPKASTLPPRTEPGKVNFKIIVAEPGEEKKERPSVGQYVWKKDLGKGMFGLVYKAVHKETNKVVAIKEIDTELIPDSKLPGVLKEAEVMAKLDHVNIVKIYEVLQGKKKVYFVIEYINRGSLQKFIKSVGNIPEQLAAPIVRQTLQGLNYLHSLTILHRDIKCGNLLLNSQGQVKLADFGTAKEDVGKNITVIGTPYWMAPEIISMAGGSTISDIWSLGCTIVEMLQGDPPNYHLTTMQALFMIVEEEHPTIPEGLSGELSHFLTKCCFVKKTNKRPTAAMLLTHPWITGPGAKSKDKNYQELVDAVQGSEVPSVDLSKGKPGASVRVKGDPKRSMLPGPEKARSVSRGRKSAEELEYIIRQVIEERDQLLLENIDLKAQLEQLK